MKPDTRRHPSSLGSRGSASMASLSRPILAARSRATFTTGYQHAETHARLPRPAPLPVRCGFARLTAWTWAGMEPAERRVLVGIPVNEVRKRHRRGTANGCPAR